MRIIITGGGTGGHIYPALAIARGIQERVPNAEILYVGTQKGMESQIVPKAGFRFTFIDISGIDRSSLIKASQSLARLPLSLWQSFQIIKSFKPDVVVGTGGYVSFPVVLAASYYPCKTFIHEQNALPGLANRCLAKRVDCTLLTFAEAQKFLRTPKICITGLPVRKEFTQVSPTEAKKRLNLCLEAFTVLVFGGSRGANKINQAMLELVEKYHGVPWQVIWITGETGYEEVKQQLEANKLDYEDGRIHLYPYMYNMEDALASSDLAICRAGASTLSELAILGVPAILVPYPYASENHQEKNAQALANKGAAEMIRDDSLDGATLYKQIEELRMNPDGLRRMSRNIKKEGRPDALNEIIDIILKGHLK
ncbi:MAG: undecaprenyldiphospho-muramoylpentapeptide beta-N-acetylglucosaminyltransferase [Syntrophomonadaceae bacterium]|jgi:UDP-N-acetylglucosamine--N-acetylmuramyl-(pentapeptide) pyrophosphoryl-undecaprenol N-acetylglucosamine transferase